MIDRLPSPFRSASVVLSLALVIAGGSFATAQPQSPPPNILVILVDDLGYGDLSSYGATDLKTPHIDGLVSKGMKFTNFYANCPVCSPTRAALLTGRYPARVGVPGVIRTHAENNWGYLHPDFPTLPTVLGDRYDTAIIGKWHLGLRPENHPLERGFDHFHGFLGDMMDDYYNHRRHGNNYMRLGKDVIDPEGHATDLFSQWSCDYLKSQAVAADRKPFFLYLAYNAPHTPIQPPKDWLEKVKAREEGISDRRAKLVALIEHMDHGIGQVLDCLDQTGQAENTLVVFTSDNGGQSNVGANNGAVRDGKGSVYEGGLKVPGCVVWPSIVKAGSTTDLPVLTMDLFPTLLAAAGVHHDGSIDGRSFLPTLIGNEQDSLRETMFFLRREGGVAYGGKTIDAVIHDGWKLLQNSPYQPLELYHLTEDPLETTDLRTKNRKKFQELAAKLRKETQRYGEIPWQKREE